MPITKSGWLWRKSAIVYRWKKSYVVLRSGRLACYEHENSSEAAEEEISIPHERPIILGPDYCGDVAPPTGCASDLVFSVKALRTVFYFCADDKDDLMAWKLSLQESLSALNGAGTSREHDFEDGHGTDQYTIYAPPGSTITVTNRGPVIYHPNGDVIRIFEQELPYYRNSYRRTYYSNGGAMTGRAFASMNVLPLLGMWWWI